MRCHDDSIACAASESRPCSIGQQIARQTVIDALRELGARDVESRDPIEWERAIAART